MTFDAPWDPNQYLTFAGPRLRPALDLMARIQIEAPMSILDLGCGAGNVTRFLALRWPNAAITGIDRSQEMLERAKQEVPDIQLIEADLATWNPARSVDLVFSNAVLQWIPDHAELVPRIAGFVSDGGVLAIQIPHNDNAPTGTAVKEATRAGPWREKLDALNVYRQHKTQICILSCWPHWAAHSMFGRPSIIMFSRETTRYWNGERERGLESCLMASTEWSANALRMRAASASRRPIRHYPTDGRSIPSVGCYLSPNSKRARAAKLIHLHF